MSYLQKIVYLTEQQYGQLEAGTLSGHPEGVQEDVLYITTGPMSIMNLAGTLPVNKGGTGAVTFPVGSLLVGNDTNALTTITKTDAATGGTVVVRDNSGNFSANIITATLNGNASSSTTTTSLICSTRPSTANTTHNASQYGRIFAFLSSSNMNNSGVKPLFTGTTAAPTALDGYILDFHWDNSGQYNPQIAINNGGKSLSIRGNVSGTWSEWVPILTRDTIGPGDANGQIKVAGNNVNITGLKALAYKDSLLSNTTDHAIVRFDGTNGEIQNSGVIIDDNNSLSIPKTLCINDYAGYGVCKFQNSDNFAEIVIKTKFKFISSSTMPTIHIHGHYYGDHCPIDLSIAYYIYNSEFFTIGITCKGGFKPDIYLFKYTENDIDYVAIGLKATATQNMQYIGFQVDADGGSLGVPSIHPAATLSLTGWTIEYATKASGNTIIPAVNTDKCKLGSYITLKTSVTSATTATNLSGAPTIVTSDSTSGAVSLSDNNTYTLTVGGKSVLFTTPNDTKVAQNINAENKKFGVLFSAYETSSTSAEKNTVNRNSNIYIHPSLSQMIAGQFTIHDKASTVSEKVSLQWNDTDQSLDFIFA